MTGPQLTLQAQSSDPQGLLTLDYIRVEPLLYVLGKLHTPISQGFYARQDSEGGPSGFCQRCESLSVGAPSQGHASAI